MNPIRKAAVAAALVGSAVGGGAIGAAFVNSSAVADTTSTTAPAATAPAQAPPQGQGQGQGAGPGHPGGPHQANGITETVLTGDTAAKVTAAAQAAVPGGTIQRVETDAEGSPYEAHMTKSDGTEVTVKVDTSFKVTTIENGHA